jgi:hypothetical protein
MASPRAFDAYRDGLGRVARAPWIWAGAWLATVLLSVPLAIVLRQMLAAHLGPSLAAEAAASGVNWDWWQEFRSQAAGLGTTFTPSILGFAAVLRNVSDLADNERLPTVIAGVLVAWLVVWSFLAGGILDRYARNRGVGSTGFFTACGTHFWRLLRLGALAWLLYNVLFSWLHPLLFDDGVYAWATRDLASERQAFAIRVALYAVFAALLAWLNVVVDYARVRIVVEDRRSALFAVSASVRFIRRHWGGVTALYVLNAAGFLAVVSLYALLAPGAGRAGWPAWMALLAGQVYIALRLGVKLGFYATQTAYFQRALAHADYVAGPPAAEWPESPAAEAIRGDVPPSPASP